MRRQRVEGLLGEGAHRENAVELARGGKPPARARSRRRLRALDRRSVDRQLELGARNLLEHALSLVVPERLHAFVYRAHETARVIDEVARALGIAFTTTDLDRFVSSNVRSTTASALVREARGATGTLLLAKVGIPSLVSVAVIDAATELGTRHAHVIRVEPRMLGQSLRADPSIVAAINQRVAAYLAPPCTLRVSSASGTSLEIALAPAHPLLTANARPVVGRWETFPSGYVSTHPARVKGTLVVDRNVLASEAAGLAPRVKRAPIRVHFEDGRVSAFETDDEVLHGIVERYLAAHVHARNVGLVVVPTNYLVRAETGMESQDELLPGVNVNLGFSSQPATKAPYEAPVQLRLCGRKQTIDVRGTTIVDAGRLSERIVSGVDPFR